MKERWGGSWRGNRGQAVRLVFLFCETGYMFPRISRDLICVPFSFLNEILIIYLEDVMALLFPTISVQEFCPQLSGWKS